MSWSTSATGTPDAVTKTVADTLNGYKCSEPEETIKAKALELIASVLVSYPADQPVSVSAHGSQCINGERITNALTISIVPSA